MLESCNKQKEGTSVPCSTLNSCNLGGQRLQVQLRLQPRGEAQRLGGGKPQRNSVVIINERNLEYMRCSAESGRAAQRMAESRPCKELCDVDMKQNQTRLHSFIH